MAKHHQYQNHKLLIAVLVIILIVLAWWAYKASYKHFNPSHVEESVHKLYLTIETDKNLTLGEVLGFRNDTQEKYVIIQKGGIAFYTLSPGWNFTRELDVKNNWWYPVEMELSYAGNISDFLTIDIPSKEIGPESQETLNLTVHIPESGVLAGDYGGNLTIVLSPKKR